MHEDLLVRCFVIIRKLSYPGENIGVVRLHAIDDESVGFFEPSAHEQAFYLTELIFLKKAFCGSEVGIGKNPSLGKRRVADHGTVFQQHFLMVASQGHHLVGIVVLEPHDLLIDLKARRTPVAVIAA